MSYGHQIALHSEDYDRAEALLQTALSLQPSSTEALQVPAPLPLWFVRVRVRACVRVRV